MGNTTRFAFPYPENTDLLANSAAATKALAQALDAKLIRHRHDGTRLDATGTNATDHPDGLLLIAGRAVVTFASSLATLTFPGGGFPNGVLALSMNTMVGSANNPVVNGGDVTKTRAIIVVSGVTTGNITISYMALGY